MYETPKIGPHESRTHETTSTNINRGAEPAVRSNVGASIAGAGGRESQATESTTEESTRPVFPNNTSVVDDPKGHPLQINATIGVPRSYFVRVYQVDQGDPAAEPDAAALDQVVQAESARIQDRVAPLIRTDGLDGAVAGTVLVGMIHDFSPGPAQPGGAFGGGAAGSGLGAILVDGGGGLVQNVGLGALALVSLLMMFLMMRRATVRESMPTAQELVGAPPTLDAGAADLVGEAEEAEPALEGMELDDQTLKTQQLLDQIDDMINTGPDDAAALLHRWVKEQE
jgi:hypothetical protein